MAPCCALQITCLLLYISTCVCPTGVGSALVLFHSICMRVCLYHCMRVRAWKLVLLVNNKMAHANVYKTLETQVVHGVCFARPRINLYHENQNVIF
jgi:hypothetical protein